MSCNVFLGKSPVIGIDLGCPGLKTKENALFEPPLGQDRRVLPSGLVKWTENSLSHEIPSDFAPG